MGGVDLRKPQTFAFHHYGGSSVCLWDPMTAKWSQYKSSKSAETGTYARYTYETYTDDGFHDAVQNGKLGIQLGQEKASEVFSAFRSDMGLDF